MSLFWSTQCMLMLGTGTSAVMNKFWGHFKNTCELLIPRSLECSYLNEIHIFQRIGKEFCVEFQRVHLKFHTKFITHTLKETNFVECCVIKQNHMVVAYFPWYFTRRPAWKPRPQRGSGFHAGSPSEVSWKICNNKYGFVFIPRLYP